METGPLDPKPRLQLISDILVPRLVYKFPLGHNLNSLVGVIADYVGDYCRGYQGGY